MHNIICSVTQTASGNWVSWKHGNLDASKKDKNEKGRIKQSIRVFLFFREESSFAKGNAEEEAMIDPSD